MKEMIEKTVKDIVYKVLKKKQITKEMMTPDAIVVDHLNADSLDIIEIMLELETAFGVNIEQERIREIQTLQNIYDFIAQELEILAEA